jgi:hypothetical protein
MYATGYIKYQYRGLDLLRRKRHIMKKIAILTVLVCSLGTGACVDNEISFFIEHAKAQPEAPNCVWSPSDEFATTGLVDLSFASSYNQGFLVQNQLMAREDYDNLKAETNGIFVEAYEVSVRLAPNDSVSDNERRDVEIYVEPESVGIIVVTILNETVIAALGESGGCLPLGYANYSPDAMFPSREDDDGNHVPRDVGFVWVTVRFLGHTNGGLDVETPEYTFGIQLCCGCLVDWSKCNDPCERYCKDPEASKMCSFGVANGDSMLDCREIYSNPSAVWGCDTVDSEGNPVTSCNCEETCQSK